MFLMKLVNKVKIPDTDHSEVKYAADRSQLASFADQLFGSLGVRYVRSRHKHLEPSLTPPPHTQGLVAGLDAAARGQDDLLGSTVDHPVSQLQTETSQTTWATEVLVNA